MRPWPTGGSYAMKKEIKNIKNNFFVSRALVVLTLISHINKAHVSNKHGNPQVIQYIKKWQI